MNKLILLTLIALSTAKASVIGLSPLTLTAPGIPAVAVQGPSSQAAVTGPDGSAIAAASHGGSIVTGPVPGSVLAAAPAWTLPAGALVAGPSGTILTNGLWGVPRVLIG